MRMKRRVGIGVFVVALLVVGGLIYSTFGRPATVVADEAAATEDAAAASEEAQPTGVVIAGVEYPVNEYGLSYGDTVTVFAAVQAQVEKDVNDELEFDDLLAFAPDLVEAKTNEGDQGYMLAEDFLMQTYSALWMNAHKDELVEEYGSLPQASLALDGNTDVVKIYAADGTTEIGCKGYAESEAVVETKKYEDERGIYTVTTYDYPDGHREITMETQVKDDAPGVPASDIEAGLWPLTIEQVQQLPEVEE